MHYGIVVVPFGLYANPKKIVQLGIAAKSAGWEALFVWDYLTFTWDCPPVIRGYPSQLLHKQQRI